VQMRKATIGVQVLLLIVRYWAARHRGKIRPDMSRKDRQQLIYRKYVLKKWVDTSEAWEVELKQNFPFTEEELAVISRTFGTESKIRGRTDALFCDGRSVKIVSSAAEPTRTADSKSGHYSPSSGEPSGPLKDRSEGNSSRAYQRAAYPPRAVASRRGVILRKPIEYGPDGLPVQTLEGMDEEEFIRLQKAKTAAKTSQNAKNIDERQDERYKGHGSGKSARPSETRPVFFWRERVICDGRLLKIGKDTVAPEHSTEQRPQQSSRSQAPTQPSRGFARNINRILASNTMETIPAARPRAGAHPLSPVPGKLRHADQKEAQTDCSGETLLDMSDEHLFHNEAGGRFLQGRDGTARDAGGDLSGIIEGLKLVQE